MTEHHDANHDVVIVGWDDAFPSGGFFREPEGERGLSLRRTAGETGFGEQGFFYVSYEDTQIGRHNICLCRCGRVRTITSRIYPDGPVRLGWASWAMGRKTAWCANVYAAAEE